MEVRTLVLWGQNDRYGTAASKALLAIPGSAPVTVPNAGHACYLEDTAAFHGALLDFSLATARAFPTPAAGRGEA